MEQRPMRKFFLVLLALVVVVATAGTLFPAEVAGVAISAERSRSGLTADAVNIAGESWPYLVGGPVDGEVVLLVHGFGGDKDNWVRFARFLSEDYRVVVPDLPGFGETSRDLEGDYSVPAQARFLANFARALDLGPFHLVGHSMGGNIAGYYAGQHPASLLSLGFVTNSGITLPGMTAADEDQREAVLIPTTRAEFDALIEYASYEAPFIPWPVAGYVAAKSVADAEMKQKVWQQLRDDPSSGLETILPSLEMPIFILWGRHDRLIDVATVDVMKVLAPGATAIVIEDAGHLPILERAAASARLYRRFLDAET
jgi:abhydrolase domain-containing protein 6